MLVYIKLTITRIKNIIVCELGASAERQLVNQLTTRCIFCGLKPDCFVNVVYSIVGLSKKRAQFAP